MPKSIYTSEHMVAMALLRELRLKSGLNQTEFAQKMGRPQSFVSSTESFSRRLDLPQYDRWVEAAGWTLERFAREIKRRWNAIPEKYRDKPMPMPHEWGSSIATPPAKARRKAKRS